MDALGTTNASAAEKQFQKLVSAWGLANIPGYFPNQGQIVPGVDPDGVSVGQTIIMPARNIVPNTILWEAKALGGSVVRNKAQQQRNVDYLSELGAGQTRNAYNIVTTADVTSVSNVRNYADERNVAVHHLVAYYKQNGDGSYSFKLQERTEGLFWGYNDREPTFTSTVLGQNVIKF